MSANAQGNGEWRTRGVAMAIVVGLGAAAYFTQIEPALLGEEQAAAQSAQLLSDENKARDLERSLRAEQEKLDSTLKQRDAHKLELQPPDQLNDRLARIGELCSANDVQVDATEAGAIVAGERHATIPVRVSARGSYRSCEKLIRSLHESMPDVAVTGLDVLSNARPENQGAGGAARPSATFAIELAWFTSPVTGPAKQK